MDYSDIKILYGVFVWAVYHFLLSSVYNSAAAYERERMGVPPNRGALRRQSIKGICAAAGYVALIFLHGFLPFLEKGFIISLAALLLSLITAGAKGQRQEKEGARSCNPRDYYKEVVIASLLFLVCIITGISITCWWRFWRA